MKEVLNSVPSGIWSGGDIPAIGDDVAPSFSPSPWEEGRVIGYFLQDGYVGVVVRPRVAVQKWWVDQKDRRGEPKLSFLFGSEIKYL